jgi:hypothetical protein
VIVRARGFALGVGMRGPYPILTSLVLSGILLFGCTTAKPDNDSRHTSAIELHPIKATCAAQYWRHEVIDYGSCIVSNTLLDRSDFLGTRTLKLRNVEAHFVVLSPLASERMYNYARQHFLQDVAWTFGNRIVGVTNTGFPARIPYFPLSITDEQALSTVMHDLPDLSDKSGALPNSVDRKL